jgi:deazaflavin-dependent oxidoreductase (nitroreductase family)
MPSDLTLKSMNAVHRTLLWLSRGRVGREFAGMPVLELVTTGRRSGRRRAVMLTSPVQRGDTYVIVASRGGDDHHPAWFLNLRDQPEVEVTVPGKAATPMLARIATPAERERLWPDVVARYRGYGAYQRRTGREIPLVLLEPRPRS